MKLSIVVATNKAAYWKRLCMALSKNDAEFEVLLVGPVGDGADNLPVDVKFIDVPETDIGAVQCWEIGARAAQGEVLGMVTDDCVFSPGCLDAVVKAASLKHNAFDMFTAAYVHNEQPQLYAHRMWCQPHMPFLPVGGFTYTETHRYMGGLDSRFFGCFWDCDLYMHQYQLGGRTTLLEGHTYTEQDVSHKLHTAHAPQDGELLKVLWPEPLSPSMCRTSPRIPFLDYEPTLTEAVAYG